MTNTEIVLLQAVHIPVLVRTTRFSYSLRL